MAGLFLMCSPEDCLLPIRVQLEENRIAYLKLDVVAPFICCLLHAIDGSMKINFEVFKQIFHCD